MFFLFLSCLLRYLPLLVALKVCGVGCVSQGFDFGFDF